MNWETLLVAFLGGGLVQGIASLAGYYAKRKEITVTDDAGVRDSLQKQVDSLMKERTGLVAEIDKLSDRCGDIEKENRELSRQNRELNDEITKLRKDSFDKERAMQGEIDTLKHEVAELKNAR